MNLNGKVYSFTVNGRKDSGPGGSGSPSISTIPRVAGLSWNAGTPLATSSLNDTRVYVTEPAKWVARLRDRATGGPILLRTWMTAGHVGASGRYDAWRETAWEMAVLLDLLSEPPELLV